jgi:hypothetical protein
MSGIESLRCGFMVVQSLTACPDYRDAGLFVVLVDCPLLQYSNTVRTVLMGTP